MATIEKKTKKPSGLTITRSTLTFTLKWKVMDANHGAGVQARYRTNAMKKGTWSNIGSLTSSDTSASITLSASSFFPSSSSKLETVTFQVRGKRSTVTSGGDTTTFDWSDWAEKSFDIDPPKKPTVSQELSGTYPSAKFSWTAASSTDDHKPFGSIEYQSILVKECSETNGAKLNWKSGQTGWTTSTSTSASSSWTKSEDSSTLAQASYTRWFRIRSRGVGGASDWAYTKHVYATPKKPKINKDSDKTYAKNASGSTINVRVQWAATTNAAYPIDLTRVEYLAAVPTTNHGVPSGSWTTATEIADSSGADVAQFSIGSRLTEDQCLWVRVTSVHDSTKTSTSDAVMILCAKAKAPTITSISANREQRKVTIQASNTSSVPGTKMAVVHYRKKKKAYVCGILTSNSSTTLSNLAPWSDGQQVSFGVYTFYGDYNSATASEKFDGSTVTYNTFKPTEPAETLQKSTTTQSGGDVPLAPSSMTAERSGETEVLVKWTWSWTGADQAEVSWSTNPNAWESTDPPETFLVNSSDASMIRVTGLEQGNTYYFKVRLVQTDAEEPVYGPYSDAVDVNLGTTPQTPVVTLSSAIVNQGGFFTAAWTYSNEDGTPQKSALIEIGSIGWNSTSQTQTFTPYQYRYTTYGAKQRRINTYLSDSLGFSVEDQQAYAWTAGNMYYIRVQVQSEAGVTSEWSDPVGILCVNALTCTISSTNLSNGNLTSLPLTATITGAGAGGVTTMAVERMEDYNIEKPDGTMSNGYAGETVFLHRQYGESSISAALGSPEMMGTFDDGAQYKIVATTQDGYGQSATAELPFTVAWSTKATTATVASFMSGTATVITISGVSNNLPYDIYRLSADRPELIIENGQNANSYVDPYPAIGEHGGHRIVFKSANGDWMGANSIPAWVDVGKANGDFLDLKEAIIDFGNDQITFEYNIELSNSWAKDFQETKYLGGSVVGDWNPAVSRKGDVAAVVVALDDLDKIKAMRRLAVYPGICHVRTPDGSSFSADIQVSEKMGYGTGGKLAEFTLSITRVDPEGLDGIAYSLWNA